MALWLNRVAFVARVVAANDLSAALLPLTTVDVGLEQSK